jgi:NADH-quinone oxidoreductase subunit J
VTAVEVLFVLLGVVTTGAAVMVAVTTNLVHAALWLVLSLGGVAGCYLLLAAEFIAWVQVLIYLGAVVVLLLFALMLTRAPTGSLPDLTSSNKWVAAATALASAGLLVTCFAVAYGDARIDIRDTDIGTAGAIGSTLFGSWVLPFEILSALLLAALVGAIVLSRRREHP